MELAFTMLTKEAWEKGPKSINATIRELFSQQSSDAEDSTKPIPPQGAGPHFTIGASGLIALAPPSEIDAEGNNIRRIRQQLPLVRRAADRLATHLNPNAFPELAQDVADYRIALSGDEARIAWGVVFGLGVMLENAATAAERYVEDPMWPRLEDAERAALTSLLTLHGPLILATAEGRELADAADRMTMSREAQTALRNDALTVATALTQDEEVIEAPAADLVRKATGTIGEGAHPERGTVFGLATVANAATILLPAATIASAVSSIGGLAGGAIALAGSLAIKESEQVHNAARALGGDYDRLLRLARDQVELARTQITVRLHALAPFRRFVTANEGPLRRIAANTMQLRWMLSYIDFIVQRTGPREPDLASDEFEWEDHNSWTYRLRRAKPSDTEVDR
jgi:hypothetical protein